MRFQFVARFGFISSLIIAAGCAAQRPSQVDPQARAAIGEAATARYPGNGASQTTATPAAAAATPAATAASTATAAAVDYPKSKELEILNLTDSAITDARVWVNGAYVRRVGTIPPRGSVLIRYGNLLRAGQAAEDFTMVRQSVAKVELETAQGLLPVAGPAVKR